MSQDAGEQPLSFATSLFSFLYHMATYETSEYAPSIRTSQLAAYHCHVASLVGLLFYGGMPLAKHGFVFMIEKLLYHCISAGDALVSSGIMESLLQVLDWKAFEPMNITVSNTITVLMKSTPIIFIIITVYVCSW